jgi:hypothetical protein
MRRPLLNVALLCINHCDCLHTDIIKTTIKKITDIRQNTTIIMSKKPKNCSLPPDDEVKPSPSKKIKVDTDYLEQHVVENIGQFDQLLICDPCKEGAIRICHMTMADGKCPWQKGMKDFVNTFPELAKEKLGISMICDRRDTSRPGENVYLPQASEGRGSDYPWDQFVYFAKKGESVDQQGERTARATKKVMRDSEIWKGKSTVVHYRPSQADPKPVRLNFNTNKL